MDQLLWFGFILAAGGAVAGFAAGLLGIGGGAILVPVLYEVFGFAGVDEAVRTHLAVGTSLAVILPTGLRSAYGHNQKQGVDWSFVKLIAVFIVVGVVIGTLIAKVVDGSSLRLVYAGAVICVGLFILWSRRNPELRLPWPGDAVTGGYGVITGILSTLMGIGGGTFIASYMAFFGRSMHQAVGTAAAIGPVIALPAMAGFMWAGFGSELVPPGSVGFVSLFGAALMLPLSVLAAPLGVRAAHGMERDRLELVFALFLILVGLRFLVSVIL